MRPGGEDAPGKITTPGLKTVESEVLRRRQLIAGFPEPGSIIELVASAPDGTGPPGTEHAIARFLAALHPRSKLVKPDRDDARAWGTITRESLESRQARQLHELDRHNSSS